MITDAAAICRRKSRRGASGTNAKSITPAGSLRYERGTRRRWLDYGWSSQKSRQGRQRYKGRMMHVIVLRCKI
jgi:hypothetical protein